MSGHMKEIQSRTFINVESCKFTWSIENFSLCGLQGTEYISSPMFTTGTSLLTKWNLKLYPNRNRTAEKEGNVGIYLKRNTTDSSAHYTHFTIAIIDSNQKERYSQQFRNLFDENNGGWGHPNFLERYVLFGREQFKLVPQDILTVMCELKASRVADYKVSESAELSKPTTSSVVFKKPDALIRDLQHLYTSNMFTDLTLKVGDEEFQVHRNILGARSSVFNSMLNCEMEENLTNCVKITDFDSLTVKMMLQYIYCGQVEGLTPEIGIQLYSAAYTFKIQDLKDICVEYLSRNLSINTFCDTLILGKQYNVEELMTATKNFFSLNAAVIKETENWVNLSKTNPDLVITMYEFTFLENKMC